MPAFLPRELSAEAIAKRYGKLNISPSNLIILDQESRKNLEGKWGDHRDCGDTLQ